MKKPKFYIGIDISKDDFAASILTNPNSPVLSKIEIQNDVSGFELFETWLINSKITQDNCVICLEATGVYGEAFSYWFVAKGYNVAIEQPLKVNRAFSEKSHKNDKVDSQKIAMYAFRFLDELRIWNPKSDIIEQLKALLMTREQLVQQKTASINTLKSLKIKVVQTPLVNRIYEKNIENLKKQIAQIEKEIKRLINKHPGLADTVAQLSTIPGVGLLLSVNFLVVTDGFKNDLAHDYRKAAAFIGICPYEHTSGTSVYKKPRTPKHGPSRLRKLLHLASRSVVHHKAKFSSYSDLKQLQGKNNRLILNNVSNKLLKIMCAIIRTQRPYIESFVSLNPQNALINT